MTAAGGWLLEERAAGAGELHEPWPPAELASRRLLRRCLVSDASLVLGSAQPEAAADAAALAAAGFELVRRRSGGGAVVVSPGAQLWFDLWLPRGDRLWVDDVVRGAFFLGELWADALGALGVDGASVHRGRATATAWSALVCFAGTGPGEVSVVGRKVVGLSQRRSRAGARLQSLALDHWDPASVPGLLALSRAERQRAARETAGAAVGLDALLAPAPGAAGRLDALAGALMDRLPEL